MTDDPARHLPHSAHRYDLDPVDYTRAMECALPIAVEYGSDIPKTQLVRIQRAGNLPAKHALLSNNQDLYAEALRYALATLWQAEPKKFEDDIASLTPVQAVRRLVRETLARAQRNPDSMRLIAAENLYNRADVPNRIDVLEQSPVILQIDRALLRGHDLGAFRTGVSAEDVYILILGLSGFATLHRNTFYALYGMDVREPHNESGVTELACDAVVAFLTTPMRTRQDNSYTHSSPSEIVGGSVAASLYDSEEFWQE